MRTFNTIMYWILSIGFLVNLLYSFVFVFGDKYDMAAYHAIMALLMYIVAKETEKDLKEQ